MTKRKKGFMIDFRINDETDRAIDRGKITLDDLYKRLTEKYGYSKYKKKNGF